MWDWHCRICRVWCEKAATWGGPKPPMTTEEETALLDAVFGRDTRS